MGYHDRDTFEKRWLMPDNKKNETSENPRIQVISPQKKLYDIQQVLRSLPERAMSVVELRDEIQNILDGG